jgi:hypothetical protein
MHKAPEPRFPAAHTILSDQERTLVRTCSSSVFRTFTATETGARVFTDELLDRR